MIITDYINPSEPPCLSAKEKRMINEAASRPIVFDDDCKPLSDGYMKKILAQKKASA